MSDGIGSEPLAYVRVGVDRPLPIAAGRYVIATEPPRDGDRLTGIGRDRAGADVLVVAGPVTGSDPRVVATATLIRASEPLTAAQAEAQLQSWRQDRGEVDRWVGAALAILDRAIRAQRLVCRDPYAIEVTLDDLATAVVGCADGPRLSAGGAGEEIAALRGGRRRRSAVQRARPGAAVSGALTGSLPLLEGEELLAVAVREANHGRLRSAAAALDAARRLLAQELGIPVVDGDPPTLDRDGLLAACGAAQDAVDRWRAGEEPADIRLAEPAAAPRRRALRPSLRRG